MLNPQPEALTYSCLGDLDSVCLELVDGPPYFYLKAKYHIFKSVKILRFQSNLLK